MSSTGQTHEDDVAEMIIICKPSLPKMMGSLHPAASLYEKPVNLQLADVQHTKFKAMLESCGVKVLDVRDILSNIGDSVKLRVELEDLAARALRYVIDITDVIENRPIPVELKPPPQSSPVRLRQDNIRVIGQNDYDEATSNIQVGSSEFVVSKSADNHVTLTQTPSASQRNRNVLPGLVGVVSTPVAEVIAETDTTALRRNSSGGLLHSPISDSKTPIDYYVSATYKAIVLSAVSADQLVDIVLTRPTVTIKCSNRDTGYTARYEFEPLTNLVFTRDQQITTCKGIVMARPKSAQRQCEVEVMKFCFDKLGLSVIGEIPRNANLEGGDFFPCGTDLCLIGIGLRSDLAAVEYLMENDLLGTTHVAVVNDRFDQNQDRMHLDCFFNILSRNSCLCWKDMLGNDSPSRRLVTEYYRDPITHKHSISRSEVEFGEYLREHGFNIIEIPSEAQLLYGCNVLNLGNETIIAVHPQTAREIVRSPHFKGDVKYLDFTQITNMYGACHCASQVVKRNALRRPLAAFLEGM